MPLNSARRLSHVPAGPRACKNLFMSQLLLYDKEALRQGVVDLGPGNGHITLRRILAFQSLPLLSSPNHLALAEFEAPGPQLSHPGSCTALQLEALKPCMLSTVPPLPAIEPGRRPSCHHLAKLASDKPTGLRKASRTSLGQPRRSDFPKVPFVKPVQVPLASTMLHKVRASVLRKTTLPWSA